MINKLNLTRKLYIFDEVKYTLLNNLIHKKCEFMECIFWTCELFESGFVYELCELLFETYYNFYALNYPKYEFKINNHLKKKNFKSILYVVNLLFYTPRVNTKVFETFIKSPKKINKIYLTKHNKFNFLKSLNINKRYYKFVAAIHMNNFHNIMFYMKNNIYTNTNELYDVVKKYFNVVKMIKLNDKNKFLDKLMYSNKMHVVLSLIYYLNIDIHHINKRKIFRKFDIKPFQKTIDEFNVISGKDNYRILQNTRLYPIATNIGCFPLQRFYFKDIKNEIRHRWDYHCIHSPIWKKRLTNYNYNLDNEKKSLIFENIEDEEAFYENYDYEFDEQSKELQECIIPEIKIITIEDWLDEIKN